MNDRRQLQADALIEAARRQAGLEDFGADDFIEPLQALLAFADVEVRFNVHGREMLKADVVRCLVNRLRMHDDIVRHPEILDEDVSDPVVVIGLGRSGTTKLHKMLSAPDDVQKTLFWRLWNPARFPSAVPGAPDPRIAAADFSGLLTGDKPHMDAAHHIAPTEVEEDWALYAFTFADWFLDVLLPMPGYFRWVMSRSPLPAYRHVKRILQYLQWQDGGKRGRPWILKSVGHLANLDALLDCYPAATLVHAHRDPLQTLPSWAKLQSDTWCLYAEPVSGPEVGRAAMECFGTAIDRYLEARRRLQLDARILDVSYEQIRSNPLPLMAEIYRRAGRDMSATATQAMADWDRNNEQGKFGKHAYSLQAFGLTAAQIVERFAPYRERFIAG